MSLAKEIKEARQKLGFSQSQAAKAWDVKLYTLQSWEQGRYEPEGLALKMLRQIIASAADKPASGFLAAALASPASCAAPYKRSRKIKPAA